MTYGAGGVPHYITVPGYSSRSQVSVFQQFPQRDGADMSDMQPEAGFSNSEPVEDAPQDFHPDVQPPEEPEPGFSNSKAVRNNDATPADETSADETASDSLEDMTVADLKDLAASRDVDLKGATKKADIIAAIEKG